jgi:hypothetical protein
VQDLGLPGGETRDADRPRARRNSSWLVDHSPQPTAVQPGRVVLLQQGGDREGHTAHLAGRLGPRSGQPHRE